MQIRPFKSGDRGAVIDLWRQCGLIVPHNNPDRDIERKLRVNPDWFLVGLIGNELVATCMVGYDGHRGWINYLAIHPAYQKSGLGRTMMGHAEALLLEVGCPKINLQVRASNAAVIDFYEALGYKQDAVVSMGKRLIPDVTPSAEQDSELEAALRRQLS